MQEGKRMCRVMQKEHAFTERCRRNLYLQSNAKKMCNLQGDAEGTSVCRMCDSVILRDAGGLLIDVKKSNL